MLKIHMFMTFNFVKNNHSLSAGSNKVLEIFGCQFVLLLAVVFILVSLLLINKRTGYDLTNMKNDSNLKSNNKESPKTPGGISKSLLTPCRRIGLSRSWKKGGSSPFISPLSGSSNVNQEKVESRKRKECTSEDECTKTPESSTVNNKNDKCSITTLNNKSTPCRNVELPVRKKSKSLISAINETPAIVCKQSPTKHILPNKTSQKIYEDIPDFNDNDKVDKSTPSRTKSKREKDVTPSKPTKDKHTTSVDKVSQGIPKVFVGDDTKTDKIEIDNKTVSQNKELKPRDLKKECIVVIQKKLFKTGLIDEQISGNDKIKKNEVLTQVLFDSDSDDVPLKNLNVKPTELYQSRKTELHTKKAEDKNQGKPKDISKKDKNQKVRTNIQPTDVKTIEVFDDEDDDDDFANTKKTILIKKTYAKVTKPSKAKSTGSITQRDIDELKSRIEAKKKLLLAKAMSEDTKELRDLIKKWQKGCQDALMELMDLMKNKFPDRSNMDYAEILQSLKIPASLVGYNADEDCFNTPDDASIVLSNLNYL